MKATEVLRKYQKQCDPDGTEVQVSRQALDEVLDQIEKLEKELITLYRRDTKNLKRLIELQGVVK